MGKFYGKIGYGETSETYPDSGIYEEVITERTYYGDVTQNRRTLSDGSDKVNYDITVSNSISVVADGYAYENFYQMKYIEWTGTLWEINEVEVQRPRLILRLGGVYNGPKA